MMEIEILGEGIKKYKPDLVLLNLKFETTSTDFEKAVQAGVKKVSDFIKKVLISLGFKNTDLKTSDFKVIEDIQYDYVKRKSQNNGYKFSQSGTISFDYSIDRLASILGAISASKEPPLCKVLFDIKDKNKLQDEIYTLAFKNAKDKAEVITKANNMRLIECKNVRDELSTGNKRFEIGNSMSKMCENREVSEELPNIFTPEDIEYSQNLLCLWLAE